MKIYKVAIIGAGSIGANKPDRIDSPSTSNILTHAHAVSIHQRTKIRAIIDSNTEKALTAYKKWNEINDYNINLYDDFKFMTTQKQAFDIAIVATPTNIHYQMLMDLMNFSGSTLKLIIAEKPFCTDSNSSTKINDISKKNNIPISIDYIRRFTPGIIALKKAIDKQKVLNCRILYTRGMHDGCHAIDLMNYLFGKCISAQRIKPINIIDRDINDPSISIAFNYEKCSNVIFQPCDGREYGIFEVDICCNKNRYRLIDNSLYIERYPVSEENEWGHKSLNYNTTSVIRQETGLNMALYNLIDNAVKFLDGKEDLLCISEDAIKVHEIIEKIKENCII